MATKTWSASTSQSWSAATWSPTGAPEAGDDVILAPNATATLTLNVNTPALNSLSVLTAGATLAMVGYILDVSGAVIVDSGAEISGYGTITAGDVSNAGTIVASAGTLTVDGAINSVATSTGTLTAGSAGILVLADATYANALTFAGTTGAAGSKVEVGASGSLTVTGGQTSIGSYNLQLLGTGSVFTNANGVSVSTGIISGLGLVDAAISATGAADIDANGGGALELAQQVSGASLALTIGSASGDAILLDGAGDSVDTVGFASAAGAGTLELASGATLTATGAIALGSNVIKLDGATSNFTDAAGITVTTGTISGDGDVDAAITASGAASIAESGGTLEIQGKISGGTMALTIGAAATDRLLLEASADAVASATFSSATGVGTLEIGASGSLTVTDALAVGADTVQLDGASGAVQLTDANGITLAGGAISNASGANGAIATATKITGYGTVGIALANGTGAGEIEASGGTLGLTGNVNQLTTGTNRALAIATTAGSELEIEGTAASAAISITNVDQTLEIGASPASLTISAVENVYGGKILVDGGTLTDASGVTLGQSAGAGVGAVSGSGEVVANISKLGTGTSNSITAGGGTLEIDGAVGAAGTPLDSLAVGSGATDELLLDGASYATGASFAGSTGTLAVNTSGALTVTDALAIGANTVELEGAGVQLSDAGGLTLAGGSIEGKGTIGPATSISGWGTVAIPLTTGTGTITANGGSAAGETTLDLTGSVSGRTLAIGTANASDLKIDGVASASAIAVSSAHQTLEIGAAGSLTLSAAQSLADGTVKLDGGTLTDASGVTMGAGATLEGGGVISAPTTINGVGAIEANVSGGTLEFENALTGDGALSIGAPSGSGATLEFDGADGATSAAFTGTGGTLEIGSAGSLTLTNALAVGANTIELDGGNADLADTAGISLTTGNITGDGVISGSVSTSQTGEIVEQGGATLEINGDIATTGSFAVDIDTGSLAADTLKLDGASDATFDVNVYGESTLQIGGALTSDDEINVYGDIDLVGAASQIDANLVYLYSGFYSSNPDGSNIYGSGSISTESMVVLGGGEIQVAANVSGVDASGGTLQFTQDVNGFLPIDGGAAIYAYYGTVEFGGASNQLSGVGGDSPVIKVDSGAAISISEAQTWASGYTLELDGSGVQFTDAHGVTMTGGAIAGTGAVSANTAISGYGTFSAALDGGSVTASAGVLSVTSDVDPTMATSFDIDQTAASSDLVFSGRVGTASTDPTIAFSAVTHSDWGTLDLTGEGTGSTFASNFHGVISGFGGAGGTAATSSTIDVTGSGGTDHVVWTQNGGSGTLQVENAGDAVLETLTLDGAYNQNQFALSPPGSVDQITYTANAPCYVRGTRILAERGETAVEELRVGECVVTASGQRRPIKWIGHREINCLAHPHPEEVWPVRIAAGAMAPGLPRRDLYVSPDHSLFFDDVLVVASQIVNGSTIARVEVEAVGYWHVELDSHDLLVAEGLAAESYLDCANRHNFANGGAVMSMHPSFAVDDRGAAIWAERSFAPRCPEGRRLAALRAWLGGRAEYLGARVTADPGLQVLADGELLTAASVVDRCFRFDIPEETSRLRLRSRSGVPSQMHRQNSDDTRRLGVNVQKMEVDGRIFALDDPVLSDGWNEVESNVSRTWRWTKGDAALPIGRSLALWIDVLPAYPLPLRRPHPENRERPFSLATGHSQVRNDCKIA